MRHHRHTHHPVRIHCRSAPGRWTWIVPPPTVRTELTGAWDEETGFCIGRFAVGRFAVGRFAIGRFAIGRFAVGRFAIAVAVGLQI